MLVQAKIVKFTAVQWDGTNTDEILRVSDSYVPEFEGPVSLRLRSPHWNDAVTICVSDWFLIPANDTRHRHPQASAVNNSYFKVNFEQAGQPLVNA